MLSNRIARRAGPSLHRCFSSSPGLSNSTEAARKASEKKWSYIALTAGGGTLIYWAVNSIQRLDADSALAVEAPVLERPRPRSRNKEEYRDSISTQHLQTKRSWDNPGVYVWGLNTGRVVAPDSDERWIKAPRRLAFFDAVLLRDLKLDREFGAAIDDKGDLFQWGVGYSPSSRGPEATLKGCNLQSLAISDDRIIALGKNGTVYSIPASKSLQQNDPKLQQDSWLWSTSQTNVAARDISPRNLAFGERVTTLVGGLEHVVMLTSSGRVYTAASSTRDFPKHGQLGIPGLGWYTRPPGAFDQPHEVTGLRGRRIKQIAAGDTHSIVLDNHGQVFGFGNNSQGQLGLQIKSDGMNLTDALRINPMVVSTPTPVHIASNYPPGSGAKVDYVAAGGENSFFSVSRPSPNGTISDAWVSGRGIWGTLGNGKLTHIQWGPTRIPFFSDLFEYNEQKGVKQSIPVKSLHVGQSHVAAVMGNVTRISASSESGRNDTNWGSDVYFFGHNENFQLGNGKRANVSTPAPIPALGALAAKGPPQTDIEMDRMQLTPAKSITFAGRSVKVEQRLECGRQCSAVYSAPV